MTKSFPLRVFAFIIALGIAAGCATQPSSTAAPTRTRWVPLQKGLPTRTTITALAVSPHDPQIIFAGAYDTTSAYLSTDQARSWHGINAGLNHATILSLEFIGDTLFAGTTAGLYIWHDTRWDRDDAVPAVSIHSITRGQDGAEYLATDRSGIFTSADGGKTWVRLPGLDGEIVASIAVLDSHTLLAGTSGDGAFLTRDRGVTWQALDPFKGEYVSFVGIDPRDSSTLYLRTHLGPFRSGDGGATWQPIEGLRNELVNAMVFDTRLGRITVATGLHGILFSNDDGKTWQQLSAGLSPDSVLALARIEGETLLAGTQTGIFISRDAGQLWQRANEGMGAPQIHALAVIPDAGSLSIATEDGLYLVDAQGNITQPKDETMRLPILSVTFAEGNKQLVYAGSSQHGIFISHDGGANWNQAGDIFRNHLTVPGIVVSPRDDQTVYARVLFERIYKSSDGGNSWHAVWSGMPTESQVQWMSFLPGDTTQMFAGTDIGLFYSNDAGESWKPRGLTRQTVFDLWFDPDNSKSMLAGATDGLYGSNDSGATWTRLALENVSVTAIARGSSKSLFAGTKYNGVWESTDNGKTWVPFGLDGESVIALAADRSRNILYAATPSGLFKTDEP